MDLNTSRLLLRRFTLDDAEAYWPLVSDPAVLRYTGEAPQRSIEAVRQVLATRPLRDYAVHGFGRMACIEKSSGRLVGFCGLKRLEDLGEVDIGYRFLPDTWGKGYATETSLAVMDEWKRQATLPRVIGLVEPENLASARVLQKIGLVFEKAITLPDHPAALHRYAASLPGSRAG